MKQCIIPERTWYKVILAIGGLLWMGAPAAFSAETPAELALLNKGQVVVKDAALPGGAPAVEAKILIPKPPERVWSVVSNPEQLMSKERKVKKVKVLSRTGNKQKVEFSVLMTRLFPPFNYVLMQEMSPPNQLRFYRLSGSFKDIQGSWKLTPVDEGAQTILTYTLKLDPGPLVPKGMLLNAVKSDLPTMMRNAKSAIDKAAQ